MVDAISKTGLLLDACQWCADHEAAEQLTRLNEMVISCSKDSKLENEGRLLELGSACDMISKGLNSECATKSPSPQSVNDSIDESERKLYGSKGNRDIFKSFDYLTQLASEELMEIDDGKYHSIYSNGRTRNLRPRSQSNPEGMSKSAKFKRSKSPKDGYLNLKCEIQSIKEEADCESKPESIVSSCETGKEVTAMIPLPHLLHPYSETYNRNGRIGIYTKEEREAILERFRAKRQRRVWKKKIRYDCRKSLADKRMRVKGRFVKMSPAQRAALQLEVQAECHDKMKGKSKSNSFDKDESSQSNSGVSDEEKHSTDNFIAPKSKHIVKRLRRHSIAY